MPKFKIGDCVTHPDLSSPSVVVYRNDKGLLIVDHPRPPRNDYERPYCTNGMMPRTDIDADRATLVDEDPVIRTIRFLRDLQSHEDGQFKASRAEWIKNRHAEARDAFKEHADALEASLLDINVEEGEIDGDDGHASEALDLINSGGR